MGWKASLIIVHNPEAVVPEFELLRQLGFDNVDLTGTWSLEEGLYPGDKSISIGSYNGCLILADDYQLTSTLEITKSPDQLVDYERVLTALYPNSEVLTVACHSGVNYHLYSLAKGGQRIRYKRVADDQPLYESGNVLPEELAVYSHSKVVDGQRLFRSSSEEDGEYDMTEDQLMEEFTFGVASRLLGVEISSGDDEELMNDVSFNRYRSRKHQTPIKITPSSTDNISPQRQSWLGKLFGRKVNKK